MKKRNRVAFFNIFSTVLLNGISILTGPLFSRLLGDSGYGALKIYNIWVSILTVVFTLQTQATLVNARVEFPEEDQKRYQSAAMGLSVLTFSVCAGFVLIFLSPISRILALDKALVCLMLLQAFGTFCVNFLGSKFTYEFKADRNMLLSVFMAVANLGVSLLLINTANDNTREVRALDTLRHDTVDGIILIATMFTPEHHAVLQSLHVPVVIVGQQYPGFSCVFHDDFGAAQAATAHMLQKGRRKPGYLGVTLLDKAVGLARREGFDSALRDAGLVPQPQQMSIAKFNMESGYHQAEQLFGRAPGLDCLFCATDSIALGALQYCRSHSLRVPEDIMIAAVGDNRIGRVAYVPLTSAHLHYRTAGDKAARLLLDMLADPHAEPQMIKLDYELKCRASTGDDNSDENVWSL